MVNEAVTTAAQRANALGISANPRYRTVAEARIVDQLLVFGWCRECRAGDSARARVDAAAALEACVAAGLPFERRDGDVRHFDPAEVLNHIKLSGMRDGDPLWHRRFVVTGRHLVGEHHGIAGATLPPKPATLPPRRFVVTLCREFDLRAWQPGDRVRLRVPLPLEDDRLLDLAIGRAPQSGADSEVVVAPGRLEVRLPVPPERTASLAVEASFTALASLAAPSIAIGPDDIDLYTRRNDGIAAVGPRVQALADELAATCREPAELVRRFWNFLLDRMIFGGVHYDELDPRHPTDSVLASRWYDCHLGSALLVALCRARQIPARIISGYLLYSSAPTYHYWAEVWIDGRGWMPVDSICADLSAMGRDAGWRDYFFGQLDYRMKTECLPRVFTGNPAIRFPRAWHLLTRIDGDGIDVGFYATASGTLIYRDHVTVRSVPGGAELGVGLAGSRTNARPL